jgi:hypothetical protein
VRDWLKKHRLEAGLFTLGIAALFTGITLIAQPGNGFWGTIGWALTIGGVLCLAGAALWEPVAEMFGNGQQLRLRALPPSPATRSLLQRNTELSFPPTSHLKIWSTFSRIGRTCRRRPL